jgi:HlyD family secretion protein
MASAQSGILSAQESWSVAQKQLDKLKAPARQEDINLAEAQVRQAEASLQLIQQQKEETLLKAPIDGQVVALNYEVGEQFSAAKAFLKLLTENNFEIDIDISEADISKISVNNTATITFDAFSEEQKFIGKVFSIEPAATVLQGVIYYKTKIELQAPEDTEKQKLFFAIKPEMTANVTINTNKKDDVLIIPSRAVIDRNGQGKFVRILNNGQIRETKVTLGLYGDEGMVEVLSGDLKEGDLVVTSVKDPSKPLQ